MYEFVYPRRVAFHDTDQAGIVHFSNFFRYLEEAEAGLFRAIDRGDLNSIWGGGAGRPDGIGWVRSKVEMEYLNPARLDDLLDVHVWISAKWSRGLMFGCQMWLGDTLIARGRLKTICVTIDGRPASCTIPPELDQPLEAAPWGEDWPARP